MAAKLIVTAGFKCAPLIVPTEYTATATARPHPVVITIQPPLLPAVFFSSTFATTPSPSTISSMVPIISATNGLIYWMLEMAGGLLPEKRSRPTDESIRRGNYRDHAA